VIEMNEPPANSYGISFMRELDAAVDAAEGDEACRIVVVRSAVPGFFCGDADIKQFRSNTPAQNIEMITVAHETLGRLAGSRRIYIAEINGHALGGGLEIALACDLRFAGAGEYWLGLPEVTLGLLPGNGGTQRLSALVSASKAMGTYDPRDAPSTRASPAIGRRQSPVPGARPTRRPQYRGLYLRISWFAARHIRPTAMESKSISD